MHEASLMCSAIDGSFDTTKGIISQKIEATHGLCLSFLKQ